MALGDIKRNVVTMYKADVSDHRRSIGDLKKSLKELADEEESAAKKRGKSMSDHVAGLTKIVGAIGAAKFAFDGYKQIVEETRLETAAAGVDIAKLDKAAGGLKTRMQLLKEAATLNNAAFKLTGDQMGTVELAMRQFTRAGFEQEEVSKKVLDAIVKLEGDGLKDFGVRVREAKTDTEKFSAIMEALAGEARKVDGATLTTAESMAQMGVSVSDSFDSIKRSIGDLVVAMQPLIDAFAESLGLLAAVPRGIRKMQELSNTKHEVMLSTAPSMPSNADMLNPYKAAAFYAADAAWQARNLPPELRQGYVDPEAKNRGLGPMIGREYASQFKGIGGLIAKEFKAEVAVGAGRAIAKSPLASPISGITYEGASGPTSTSGSLGASDGWSAGSASFDPSQWIGNRDFNAEYAAWNGSDRSKRGDSDKLAEMFGPIDQINGYQLAFEGLSGAVTAAMDAWIDGSATAGEAMKKFSAGFLKSLASMLMIESLKHAAYAIASAIPGPTFNPGAVGGHVAAAAAFAGASVLAGAGAKALGGSSAGSSAGARGGAGAAPSGSYASSSNNAQPTQRTIVIGNGFLEGGPRERQIYATRLVEAAITSGAVTYSS